MQSRWLLVLVCACGDKHVESSVTQSPPVAAAKLPVGPPFVTPGERMGYSLSVGDLELATYDLAVGDLTEIAGKRAVVVQSHAKALGLVDAVANVDDRFTSWIDVANGRPLRWVVDELVTSGADRERTDARMYERAGDTLPIHFHVNDQPPTPERQKLSTPDVWDFNAFLIALRAWEAPPGSTLTAEVLRSRFLWHVTMTMRGREMITTELGQFAALRLDGHTYKLDRDGSKFPGTPARDFSIWISDDADRVPLMNVARTDYGDIKMKIVEYTPGNGARLRN